MSHRNMYMYEAVANISSGKVTKICAEWKKKMQTCRLTKFASKESCDAFYRSFFLGDTDFAIPEDDPITVQDYGMIYSQLMNDYSFMENLSFYMASYQPQNTGHMFRHIVTAANREAAASDKHRVIIYGRSKATLSMIQLGFDNVRITMNRQVVNHGDFKFLTVVDQTLMQHQMSLEKKIQGTLQSQVKVDDVSAVQAKPMVDPDSVTEILQEDSRELLSILENADQWIESYMLNEYGPIDEAVVSNAREKAKELNLRKKKAVNAFEEFVMKKFRNWQIERRNKKHSEAIGESLRIMRYLRRILAIGGLAILSPAAAVVAGIVTFAVDHVTDKKDLRVLIGLIKDDIEIVEEKISMAERNGDDKAKIELMRYRQKLYREYERLNKVAFDKVRLNRNV